MTSSKTCPYVIHDRSGGDVHCQREAEHSGECDFLEDLFEHPKPPPLTHVAIRFRNKIWSLPRPYRHHNIIRMIIWLDPDVDSVDAYDSDGDQGFLDAEGRYLTRAQALPVAEANNQIRGKDGKVIGGPLTSEDLW